MGFPLRGGAFFSARAWEGKQRQAVLNEKAALTIFGGTNITGGRFRIRGETWLVSGVIGDGDDENCRVYVPSSLRGGGALSLLALMEKRRGTGEAGEASVKNSLKALDIREGAFAFYNLETQSRLLGERVLAALGVFAGLFLLCLTLPLGRRAGARIAALRRGLGEHYLGELVRLRRKDLWRCAALILALAAALVLALLLARALLSLCLPWGDIPALGELNRDFFSLKLEPLRRVDLPSRLLFGASLGSGALFCAVFLREVLSKP
jgi:hypothetical protein